MEEGKMMNKNFFIIFSFLVILALSVNADVFVPHAIVSNISGGEGISTGDFNADGWTDIVTVNDTYTFIFYNNKDGTFSSSTIGNVSNQGTKEVFGGDINNDGYDDFVTCSVTATSGSIVWFRNNQDGTFTKTVINPTNTVTDTCYVADIDLDGDLDIAYSDQISPFDNGVFYNIAGTGAFTKFSVGAIAGEANLGTTFIADVNSDGLRDIVTAGSTTKQVFYFSQGDSWAKKTIGNTIAGGVKQFAQRDLNKDGTPDLVAMSGNGFTTFIYDIASDSFTPKNYSQIGIGNPYGVVAFDWNNDGYADLFLNDGNGAGGGRFWFFLNDQIGNFSRLAIQDTNNVAGAFLALADFNNDGLMDVTGKALNAADKSVYWFENQISQPITCTYPILFCDNFNYGETMNAEKGWLVYRSDGTIDYAFRPLNNKLSLIQNASFSPFISTSAFQSHYTVSSSDTVTQAYNSPLFSSEFQLNIQQNCAEYFTYDKDSKQDYDLLFCANQSVQYFNGTSYNDLCTGCISANTSMFIKINSYFGARNAFEFNSTQTDHINIYKDGVLLGTISKYIDSTALNLQKYYFIKSDTSLYTIDNYFIMVGTDTSQDNSYNYLKQFFTPVNTSITPTGAGSGDLATAVEGFWPSIGLKSLSSRIIFAVLLLLVFAGVYLLAWVSFAPNHPPNSILLIILEVILMILLIVIKLLPIWIPIVLGLLFICIIFLIVFVRGRGGG